MLRGSIRKLTVESMGMQFGVSGGGGGGSLIGGHERGGVMLDRLEHLLPIPTGAKMDRWRKNGDTEDREGKKDEVKGEERDKNAQETFSCIMYTDRVSNMVCLS